MNKINLIACGGTGISIADKVIDNLNQLGDGFAKFDIKYIDTSDNNIQFINAAKVPGTNEIKIPNTFWKVKSDSFTGTTIEGSGSIRKSNAKEINNSVKEFLDHFNFKAPITGEYTVIVSSASGGSGSVISPAVATHMMKRGIPVIVVLIGDSRDAVGSKNTLATIKNFDDLARKVVNKPLNIIYINNASFSGMSNKNIIEEANKKISNTLATLALFLSGENADLDAQDMYGIIDQSHYDGVLNIPAGLYGLATFSNDFNLPDGAIPMVSRTLSEVGGSPDININPQHFKVGYVTSENAINILNGQFPVHMVTFNNFFEREVAMIKKVIEDFKNVRTNIKPLDIDIEDEDDITFD